MILSVAARGVWRPQAGTIWAVHRIPYSIFLCFCLRSCTYSWKIYCTKSNSRIFWMPRFCPQLSSVLSQGMSCPARNWYPDATDGISTEFIAPQHSVLLCCCCVGCCLRGCCYLCGRVYPFCCWMNALCHGGFVILREVRFRVLICARGVRCKGHLLCLIGFRRWRARFCGVARGGWIFLSILLFFVWIWSDLRYDLRITIGLFTRVGCFIVPGLSSFFASSWYLRFNESSKNWNSFRVRFSRPHFCHNLPPNLYRPDWFNSSTVCPWVWQSQRSGW